MRSVARTNTALCATLLLTAAMAVAQQIPPTEEQNLLGQNVALPQAVAGRIAILVLGFTRASKEPTTAWGKALRTQSAAASQGFELYELPVLEAVPRMIRGMVISSMKSGVPQDQRSHFVPVLHNEAEWKKVVDYKAPDAAYVLVLDQQGLIALRLSGEPDSQNVATVLKKVESLRH